MTWDFERIRLDQEAYIAAVDALTEYGQQSGHLTKEQARLAVITWARETALSPASDAAWFRAQFDLLALVSRPPEPVDWIPRGTLAHDMARMDLEVRMVTHDAWASVRRLVDGWEALPRWQRWILRAVAVVMGRRG